MSVVIGPLATGLRLLPGESEPPGLFGDFGDFVEFSDFWDFGDFGDAGDFGDFGDFGSFPHGNKPFATPESRRVGFTAMIGGGR